MLGRTSRRTHTRGVQEKARWGRKLTGRTQEASRKRLVGGASSQDAHKRRPGKGSLGAQAHRTHTRGVPTMDGRLVYGHILQVKATPPARFPGFWTWPGVHAPCPISTRLAGVELTQKMSK